MMAMTRKDYEAIAQTIAVMGDYAPTDTALDVIHDVAINLSKVFMADNPSFDQKRFLIACGLNVQ